MDTSIKVLVVDDMMVMRKVIIKACKEIGFSDFTEAEDGIQAWDVMNQTDFGLVISDWNMPKCTGLNLLKKIRQNSKLKSIPFVLLTAESEKDQVMEAIQSGVDSYITKPFTAAIVQKKLNEVFKKKVS